MAAETVAIATASTSAGRLCDCEADGHVVPFVAFDERAVRGDQQPAQRHREEDRSETAAVSAPELG